MRKRATEGTKISTSLSITKKIVRTRRRADRLCSTIPARLAEARQQVDQPAGARGEQGRSIKASGGSLARLAARRVGHDQIGKGADLELLRDRQPQSSGSRRRGCGRRGGRRP